MRLRSANCLKLQQIDGYERRWLRPEPMPVCLEATDLGFCQRRPMKRLGVRPQTLITVNLMQKSRGSLT